jgi:hypothetical protein
MALERSLHRLGMRYDADRRRGFSFSGSEPARQELLPSTQSHREYGLDAIASRVRLPLQPLQPLRRKRWTESLA